MLVDVGDSGSGFPLKSADIPELRRVGVDVEKVMDAKRGAPTLRKRMMNLKVRFGEPFAINLTLRGRGRRIGTGIARAEIMRDGGLGARPRRQRIIPKIAQVQGAAPGAKMGQIQRERTGCEWRIGNVFA